MKRGPLIQSTLILLEASLWFWARKPALPRAFLALFKRPVNLDQKRQAAPPSWKVGKFKKSNPRGTSCTMRLHPSQLVRLVDFVHQCHRRDHACYVLAPKSASGHLLSQPLSKARSPPPHMRHTLLPLIEGGESSGSLLGSAHQLITAPSSVLATFDAFGVQLKPPIYSMALPPIRGAL